MRAEGHSLESQNNGEEVVVEVPNAGGRVDRFFHWPTPTAGGFDLNALPDACTIYIFKQKRH